VTVQSLPGSLMAYPRIGDWLELGADGRVMVFTGKVEFGQGIRTALAQIVAHELAFGIERVTVAPVDTIRSPDEGVTSGSKSIEEANEGLRWAAAAMRAALCRRAAARLGVGTEDLTVRDGEVHAPDGRRVEGLSLGPVLVYDMPEYGAAMKVKGLATVVTQNTPRSFGIVLGWFRKF